MKLSEKKISRIFSVVGLEDVDTIKDYAIINEIPIHFTKTFTFYNVYIKNNSVSLVVLEVLDENKDMNEVLQKYDWLRSKYKMNHYVLAFGKLSTFMKKQLLLHQIPFIDGNNQIFLPFVGLNLINTSLIDSIPYTKQLTPSEQVVFFTIIYNYNVMRERVDASFLIEKSNLSKPTVYRALETLTEIGIFEVDPNQSYKSLYIVESARNLWDKVQPLLINPVRKIVYLDNDYFYNSDEMTNAYLASVNALSVYTNIIPENEKTYAISASVYNSINDVNDNNMIEVNPNRQGYIGVNETKLEIWQYSPIVTGRKLKKKCVDPLSLYLTMVTSDDPRIESELEELLSQVFEGEYEKQS